MKILEPKINKVEEYDLLKAFKEKNFNNMIFSKNVESNIKIADVSLMIKQPLDDNIYNLIDMVLNKYKKGIFKIYNDFKIEKIEPPVIIGYLINKFQEMYDVYILAKGGADQQAIMDLFNVSSGKAYYMLKNSKQVSIEEIKKNLDDLINLDYNIKTGRIDQHLGLELYLLR